MSYNGVVDSSIDGNGDGLPEVLRTAQVVVNDGPRCGNNFASSRSDETYLNIRNHVHPPLSSNDDYPSAILCQCQAVSNTKEQDGDSGGPLMILDGSTHVQIGVNTASYAADAARSNDDSIYDNYIGFYTRVDHSTIKPWLEKILAGDLAGAKAMTCTSLGGECTGH